MNNPKEAALIDAMIDHDMNWYGADPEKRQEILLRSSLIGNTMAALADGTKLPIRANMNLDSVDLDGSLALAAQLSRTGKTNG